MEVIVTSFGTLGPLLSATADFYHNVAEDDDGFILANDTAYLTNVPCMPATGRNTRQDGIIFVQLAGALPYETKWSAFDLNSTTRGQVAEQDTVTITQKNRAGATLSSGTYIVAGVTEYDAPELGFAFAVLSLKDATGDT